MLKFYSFAKFKYYHSIRLQVGGYGGVIAKTHKHIHILTSWFPVWYSLVDKGVIFNKNYLMIYFQTFGFLGLWISDLTHYQFWLLQ